MSSSINQNLVKAIADIAIFLEFTDEKLLDADTSVEALQQLATELQLMNDEDRSNLSQQLRELSGGYVDKHKAQFIENLPESLGLE
jgi:hypothetical protein